MVQRRRQQLLAVSRQRVQRQRGQQQQGQRQSPLAVAQQQQVQAPKMGRGMARQRARRQQGGRRQQRSAAGAPMQAQACQPRHHGSLLASPLWLGWRAGKDGCRQQKLLSLVSYCGV